MGYYLTDGGTRVFFQNGMDNHEPDAKASSDLLAGLLGEPVGSIINDSHGIADDVREYLPDTLAVKDILNEYTYRKLNEKGEPVLIVMHSAGNEDARKALRAGQIYGYRYPNLSFLSAGSPVGTESLKDIIRQASAQYLGQVNDWRDPVTYFKTAAGVAIGTTVAGAAAGAWYGANVGGAAGATTGAAAGPFGAFFLGGLGAGLGAGLSFGPGYIGIKNHHPFAQYFETQELQQKVLDWQKQQEK